MKECNKKSPKASDPNYVCNPETGRWVKKDGLLGKKLRSNKKPEKKTSKPKSPKLSPGEYADAKPKSPVKGNKKKSNKKSPKKANRALPIDKLMPKVGDVICNWKISNYISRGAFGSVFSVIYVGPNPTKLLENTEWIMKLAPLHKRYSSEVTSLHQEYQMYRRLREFKTIDIEVPIKVSDHYRYNCDDKYSFIVIEKLDRVLTKDIVHNFDSMCKLGKDIFKIIRKIHASGVVYRDIKPDNFMFDKKGKLHLIDFGASNGIMIKPERIMGSTAGTPNYTSIDVDSGYSNLPKDDLESICYMLIDMVCDLPWSKSISMEQLAEIKSVSTVDELVSPIKNNDIKKLLKKWLTYARNLKWNEKINYKFFFEC